MSTAAVNSYSRNWFEFFHHPIPEERTKKECGFICAQAPLPEYRKILDVCCGGGRHARALAALGYAVTGIERDAVVINQARQLGGGPSYVQKDIRDYRPTAAEFDAIIIMSQSFGYFDEAANFALMKNLSNGLRAGGRLILDLWSTEFFRANEGACELKSALGVVSGTQQVVNDRLRVTLDYPDQSHEEFEWQLFAPEKVAKLAKFAGLELILSCADFEVSEPPSPLKPRVEHVFERKT